MEDEGVDIDIEVFEGETKKILLKRKLLKELVEVDSKLSALIGWERSNPRVINPLLDLRNEIVVELEMADLLG